MLKFLVIKNNEEHKDFILKIEKIIKNFHQKSEILIPNKIEWGHLSTNILRFNIEKYIVLEELYSLNFVEKIEEVSGFLNIFLRENFLLEIPNKIEMLDSKENKYIIEYTSPNPTGPLHFAHLRGALIGDSLSKLLKHVGYNVETEMYINDQGNQMDKFIETVKYYLEKRKFGHSSLEIHYKGDYVKDIADKIEEIDIKHIVDLQIENIKKDLEKIGVKHDNIFFESSLIKEIEIVKNLLDEKKMLYNDQEKGHLLFKSSLLGDSEDRVFQRNDGRYTYFGFDIAYLYNKSKRCNKQICVLGEDHVGHITKVKNVSTILGVDIAIVSVSHVKAIKDEKNIAMSKREGSFITVQETLDVISVNEMKFLFLSRSSQKTITMDFDNLENNNDLFNLLYILERIPNIETSDSWTVEEQEVCKMLFWWNYTLREAVKHLDSHRIFEFGLQLIKKMSNIVKQNKCNKLVLEKFKNIIHQIIEIFSLSRF